MQVFEAIAHLFHPRRSNNHRPKILHPEGFAFLVLLVMGVSAVSHVLPQIFHNGSILGYSSTITVSTVVDQTNKEREKLGLSNLQLNQTLSQAAAAKAANMFEEQYWAHFAPSGKTPWDFIQSSGYRYTVAGENLARDFLETDQMVNAWMNSPSHRDNIVNPKYNDVGIAVVNGVLQGTETTLVVQMFGASGIPRAAQISQQAPQSESKITVVDVSVPEQLQQVEVQSNNIPQYLPPTSLPKGVLATSIIDVPGQLYRAPLLSPLQLSKAFFLAITMLVLSVLAYDTMVIENRNTVRFVGKNLAHIALFMIVFFLILFFKSGVIL